MRIEKTHYRIEKKEKEMEYHSLDPYPIPREKKPMVEIVKRSA